MSNMPQVQSAGTTLGQLIAKNQRKIASVLPKHLDVDRLARLALSEASRNPELLKCSPQSFISSLIQAAQLGLEPGVAGLGYLIPRYNKHAGGMECTFQAGYKGLVDLARRSGKVGAFMAAVVREGDSFDYALGTSPFLTHKPSLGSRGEVTHVYATARLTETEDWQFVVLTKDQVEEFRARGRSRGFSPWDSDWEAMACKTAARQLCKWLPMSVEAQRALGQEEAVEVGAAAATAFAPEDLDLSAAVPEPDSSLAGRIAAAEDALTEPVEEPDDWAVLGGADLADQVTRLASSKLKWKRACADLVARGDEDGLRMLAREIAATK